MPPEATPTSEPVPVAELTANPLWITAADGLLLVDQHGTIRAANAAAQATFGYETSELVGETIEVLIPSDLRERHIGHRHRYEDQPWDRAMLDGSHFRGLRANRNVFPVSVGLSQVQTDEGVMTVAAVRDTSEREQIETELALAHRHNAIAEEHDRIARDLHDSVVQRLFALGLSLDRAAADTDDELASVLGDAVDRIDDTIGDIRNAIYDLRREHDDDAATTDRLLNVIVEAQESLGFRPQVVFGGGLNDIDDAVLVEHLRKVLREALSNIARHANATSARVEVTRLDGEIVLCVQDDGDGLRDSTPGLGLSGMRRRAEGLGGTFTTEGNKPRGTRVRWTAAIGASGGDS